MSAKSVSAIGFLTVVEDDQLGHCGGYLLLNTSGRPLEFHCTAPVKPNRAQEVLYGPTLKPFLYGELIGKTLVERAKVDPIVICSDVDAVLTLRAAVSVPVTLVLPATRESAREKDSSDPSDDVRLRLDAAHDTPAGFAHLHQFDCAGSRLAVQTEFIDDESSIRQQLEPHSTRMDLAEPFERIREAIREAQGSKR